MTSVLVARIRRQVRLRTGCPISHRNLLSARHQCRPRDAGRRTQSFQGVSMQSRTALAGACALIFCLGAGPADAATRGTVRVAHNAPTWALHAQATGRRATGTATVSVYLRLRNERALQRSIAAHAGTLSPSAFRARYAPSAGSLNAVRGWLRDQGLHVGASPSNRTYVDATGTVRRLERVFGVSERLYRYRGRTLRAARQNPSVPSALARTV